MTASASIHTNPGSGSSTVTCSDDIAVAHLSARWNSDAVADELTNRTYPAELIQSVAIALPDHVLPTLTAGDDQPWLLVIDDTPTGTITASSAEVTVSFTHTAPSGEIAGEPAEEHLITARDMYGRHLLSVGQLRELLARCDDDDHVVIATENWYTNVTAVALPDGENYSALTLFPAPGENYDSRQH